MYKCNKRLETTEEKISEPEEITKEIHGEKKKSEKNEKNFSDLWDKITQLDIYERGALGKGEQKICWKK